MPCDVRVVTVILYGMKQKMMWVTYIPLTEEEIEDNFVTVTKGRVSTSVCAYSPLFFVPVFRFHNRYSLYE